MTRATTVLYVTALASMVIRAPQAVADPPPPYTVSVVEIRFNHNTSDDSGDATTIETAAGTVITAPEWQPSIQKPVCCVQGSSKTIKVKFSCTDDDAQDVPIWATKTTGDRLGSLGEQSVDFSGGYSDYISFTVAAGDVGSSVKKKGSVTWMWKWRYYGTYTCEIGTATVDTIYTVLSAPVSPEGDPELDILGYACGWGHGLSAGSSIADAIIDSFANHFTWDQNCMSLASDYAHLVGSLGLSSTLQTWAVKTQWEMVAGDMLLQRTKQVDPIGSASADTLTFGYHVWAEAGGIQCDPSWAVSHSGTWGSREDSLYMRYRRNGDNVWLDNQNGQTVGVEDYQGNRCVHNNPEAANWTGPTR